MILNLRDGWRDVLAGVKSEVINLEFIKKIRGMILVIKKFLYTKAIIDFETKMSL